MHSKSVTLALMAMLALSACSRLTMDNYNRIKTGMQYDEVVSLLGKPDSCSEALGVRTCLWGSERRHVQVNFVAGQVMLSYAHNLD